MAKAQKKRAEQFTAELPDIVDAGAAALPPGFYRSLGAMLASEVSVEDFRADLANFLYTAPESAPAMKAALLQARAVGRLPAHIHSLLKNEIRLALTDECPTESLFGELDEVSVPSESEVESTPEEVEGVSVVLEGDSHVEVIPEEEQTGEVEAEQPAYVRLRPGMLLGGRYRLERAVRGGHVGAVFMARDERREQTGDSETNVAIKTVSPRFRDSAPAARALRNEARLTRSLSHQGIVRVHDFDVEAPHEFIVMEWLDGESLAARLDRLRPLPMPADEVKRILRGVAAALDFAHEQEVTHGDVKPGNVFLTSDGGVKLLDFGMSVPVPDREDDSGPFALSKAYASYDLLRGRPAKPSDDVYSVACMAYRMLSGRRVYGAMSAIEADARSARIDPVPGLTAAQWRVLEDALSFDPQDRPLTAGEFVDALFGTPLPTSRITHGRRILANVVLSAVTAAAIVIGSLWYLSDRAVDEPVLLPLEPSVVEPDVEVASPTTAMPDVARVRAPAARTGELIRVDSNIAMIEESAGSVRVVARGDALDAANLRVLATTVPMTASAGVDYRSLDAQILQVASDGRSAYVDVDIMADSLPEGDETFAIVFEVLDGRGERIDSATVKITIADGHTP